MGGRAVSRRAISRDATWCMMVRMAIRPRLVWPLLVLVAVLAACGGATGSPAASEAPPSQASASELPATEAPPPGEAPSSEAPSPAGDAGGPFAEALVAALGTEELITHIEQEATVTTSVAPDTLITAMLAGDISGEDLAMEIMVSAPGVLASIRSTRSFLEKLPSKTGFEMSRESATDTPT